MSIEPTPGEEPTRDFSKMFDLDRSTLINSMVDRMEECMRQQQAAADDLKQVVADCKEKEIGEHDITAMKKIAKMRLKDQLATAREQVSALERVGKLVGFDLFSFADANPKH
jgi:uncharacterized protein (UPF0335 family)